MQLIQIHLINHEVLEFELPNKNLNVKDYYQSCLKNNDLIQIAIKNEGDTYINPNHILYITVKNP